MALEVAAANIPSTTEKSGLRERQRLERDATILKAAFDLIAERGYDALTMESLAEWVGITRQTLYHHFCNKDEIVLKAILAIVDDATKLITTTGLDLSASERLVTITRLLLRARFSPTRSRLSKAKPSFLPFKTRPEYRAAFDRRSQALEQIVIEAQDASQIRTDIPSSLIVQMLLSLLSESNYEDLIAQGAVSSDQVVESVVDLFFSGLMPGNNVQKPHEIKQ